MIGHIQYGFFIIVTAKTKGKTSKSVVGTSKNAVVVSTPESAAVVSSPQAASSEPAVVVESAECVSKSNKLTHAVSHNGNF